jgi:pyruvate dehydrogenase E1 component
MSTSRSRRDAAGAPALPLDVLKDLERKVLWLATQTIHHANHERNQSDGLKVGGHQASSASLVSIMTALYFAVLRPEDRVAVKPHASPVFHAIQYLLGNQDVEQLKAFRAFGGAQSYPSRTKDVDDVDFSTGSVGLGVAMTSFASLVQDYIHAKGWKTEWPQGRMIALVGDAELDEGNIYEAMLEGFKHGLRNTWWIIDYNRQSLDAVLTHLMTPKLESLFDNMGWRVVTVKYGRKLEALRASRVATGFSDGSTSATTRSIRRSPSKAVPDGAASLSAISRASARRSSTSVRWTTTISPH